jgi:hypothetical protein
MEDLACISKGKMWQKLIYFSHNLTSDAIFYKLFSIDIKNIIS